MTRASFVFLVVAVVAGFTRTEGRPNKLSFEDDEEYVNTDIVKKGDINKKKDSPSTTEKSETKNTKKKQFIIDTIHHGPYHGGHSWGTTSLWPGHNTAYPGHGFASAPGNGWNGYPSYGFYKSKIPKGRTSEVKSPSSLHKRWWPGYSGGWGGWGNGNTGYPGWGSGFGFGGGPGMGYGGHYGGLGHGYLRSGIPEPRYEVGASKRWWPGYSGGWGGWGVGNSGYPGWGSGWAHGWSHPGSIGWGAGHGFAGHGNYRSSIPQGPRAGSTVGRAFVDGYHPGVYGWGGQTHGWHGGAPYGEPYGAPWPYFGPGPYGGGPYGHGFYGPWGGNGYIPSEFPNTFDGPAEFGPFGDRRFGPFRRHILKQSAKEENAKSRQVIGYHPGCYGWGGVFYPGCEHECGFDCGGCGGCGGGCGGFGGGCGSCGGECGGCGGGCGGCGGGCGGGGGGCGGCGGGGGGGGCGGCGGGCGGCGGGCGGCGCRSKTPKNKETKDVKAKTRQEIESPGEALPGPSSELINLFNNAGLPSQGGNAGFSAIPGIQQDLTAQIESSKSQFPEYSNQFSSSFQEENYNEGDSMQNFRLSPTGDNNQISLGETGNPTANEASAFSMQGTASRRANIPQKKRSKAIKKQSVPYPFPYASGGQPMVPFYGAMNHPFQHLAAVPHYPMGYTAALIPQYHAAHNIHVGSPNVNVDVQTTRAHVAKRPNKNKKSFWLRQKTLRRLVRDLEDVLEDESKRTQHTKAKRQAFNYGVRPRPRAYGTPATRYLVPSARARFPMVQRPVWRSFTRPVPNRLPYVMQVPQQAPAMAAMQRSGMRRFRDPPPLTERQIAKMAGISVPLAIQPGAGFVGINKRGKRTTKKTKTKTTSKSQKRFLLASPLSGSLVPTMQFAPAIPVAGYTAHAPPAIPLPFVRTQPLVASMTNPLVSPQLRLANYPSVLSPLLHQPLGGYPVANLQSSHRPLLPPFFSSAAMPLQYSSSLPGATILRQSMPAVARQ
ncbi:hypothetical protein QZH41_014176, partial [Actinostola sp. cb2023]